MKTKIIMMLMFFALLAGCKEKQKSTSSQQESTHESEIENSQAIEPYKSVGMEFTHDDYRIIFNELVPILQLDITVKQIDDMFANFYPFAEDENDIWECASINEDEIRICNNTQDVGKAFEETCYRYCNNSTGRCFSVRAIGNTSLISVSISNGEENINNSLMFFDYNQSNRALTQIPNEQLVPTIDYSYFMSEDIPEEYIDNIYLGYSASLLGLHVRVEFYNLEPHESKLLSSYVKYPMRHLVWNGEKYVFPDVKIDTPTRSSFAAYCTNILELSEKDVIDFYNGKATFLGGKFHEPYVILRHGDERIMPFKIYDPNDILEIRNSNVWALLKTNEGNYLCVFIYWRESHMIDHNKWVCSIEMFDYDAETQNIHKLESISQYLPSVSIDDFFSVEKLDAETKAFLETYWAPTYEYKLFSDFHIHIEGLYPSELVNANVSQNLSEARKRYILAYDWNGEKFVIDDGY